MYEKSVNNSMELYPIWEENGCRLKQEMRHVLWNMEACCHAHVKEPLNYILNLINAIHIFKLSLFKTDLFIVILFRCLYGDFFVSDLASEIL
jgi:hypothetical protein